jgi:hypothetical protein
MKKVSKRREELRRRAEAITQSSRKFRWWGIAFVLLGIGLALGGFFIGILIYSFGFGLLLFSLVADLIAWRLRKKFRGT